MNKLKKITRFLVQVTWLIFATISLLEIGVRLIFWWSESTVTLFDKEISLLPKPLVTHDHLNILKNWANSTDTYEIFDPILGWSIRPNAVVEKEGITYSSNSIGIRSLREYELIKPTMKSKIITRIAAFGPSFTFGDQVKDSAAWPAQMEQTCPNLEVMNWGIGGYGTDQVFLRYQTQGVNYQPDIVLIGYETDNESRNVNRFRPFYKGVDTDKPLTKPVYVLKQDELVLLKNPFETFDALYDTLLYNPNHFLETVCPQDNFCNEQLYLSTPLDVLYSWRFFRTLTFEMKLGQVSIQNGSPKTDPREISLRLLEMFIKEVDRHGSRPVVIFFPQQAKALAKYEQGQHPYYDKFIPVIQNLGVQVIDLDKHFVEAKQTQDYQYEDFFTGRQKGHYNELGNHIVSQAILDQLCASGSIASCCQAQ